VNAGWWESRIRGTRPRKEAGTRRRVQKGIRVMIGDPAKALGGRCLEVAGVIA